MPSLLLATHHPCHAAVRAAARRAAPSSTAVPARPCPAAAAVQRSILCSIIGSISTAHIRTCSRGSRRVLAAANRTDGPQLSSAQGGDDGFEGLLPEEDPEVPGSYLDALNSQTKLGKAVKAAVEELEHLGTLEHEVLGQCDDLLKQLGMKGSLFGSDDGNPLARLQQELLAQQQLEQEVQQQLEQQQEQQQDHEQQQPQEPQGPQQHAGP